MSGKKLLLALCLIFSFNVFSQNIATVDSLLELSNSDDTSHISLSIQALNLAKTLDYEKGQGRALHKLGYQYEKKGNYPLAIQKYLQSEYIRNKTGEDEMRGFVYINIAFLYDKVKDYDSEIRYAEQALKIVKSDSLKCFAHNSMGKAYLNKGIYDSALHHFNTSIAIKEKKGNKSSLHREYNGLGNALIKAGNYDAAIRAFSKIYNYAMVDKKILAKMNNNIGVCYHSLGNFQEAEHYFLEAIKYNNREESGDACLNYAEILFLNGQAEKANEYVAKALTYNYDLAHLGRTLHALHRFEESSQVRDSLYRHATTNYEFLNQDGLEVARIENEMLHERERVALREKYETERKYKFTVICIFVLCIGLIIKYLWEYYFKMKSTEKLLDNYYLDLRKNSKSSS
jgi:tetratricopeptide (TPR) repeat protein